MSTSTIDAVTGGGPTSDWFVSAEELVVPPGAPVALAPLQASAPPEEAPREAPPAVVPDPAMGVEWQRLWLATQRRPWTTLALIPVGEDIPVAQVSAALVAAGRQHLSGTIVACDETKVSLSTLESRRSAIVERARCAERVIVALPDVLQSPAALALAQAADAAILCVGLGSSAIDEAERIVEELGRERVLGSVIFRERKAKP